MIRSLRLFGWVSRINAREATHACKRVFWKNGNSVEETKVDLQMADMLISLVPWFCGTISKIYVCILTIIWSTRRREILKVGWKSIEPEIFLKCCRTWLDSSLNRSKQCLVRRDQWWLLQYGSLYRYFFYYSPDIKDRGQIVLSMSVTLAKASI